MYNKNSFHKYYLCPMNKFCYKCGKEISKDSLFCSYCETKQDNELYLEFKVGSILLSISSRATKTNREQQKKGKNQIDIPDGYHFCSYCGKVKSDDNFYRTLGEEFNMCNKCYKRNKNIEYTTIFAFSVIALTVILLSAFSSRGFWADNLAVVGGVMIIFIPLSILFQKIFYALIKKLLQPTPLRVTLSKKRIKWLRECKDAEGKPIITPIERSEEELKYYNITNAYFSRDIPYGYYRCPSCEQLHLIESAQYTDNEDKEIGSGSTLIGGVYYTITTKEYSNMVCPNCYKHKKVDKYIRIAVPLICLITAYTIFMCTEGFDCWGLLSITFVSGAIGLGLAFIFSFVYKVLVYLICRENLFYKYKTAAEYGALKPKI